MSAAVEETPVRRAAAVSGGRKRSWRRIDTAGFRAVLQFAAVVAVFALWQAGVRAGWISGFLMGEPIGIAKALVAGLRDGSLLLNTWITVYESILGFIIGTALGSALGLGLWYSIFVARLTEPFIVALNSVPKIALAPIVILWFGTGLVSKVALAVSLTALVALIAAYQGAKDADQDLQKLLLSMGANKHQVFWKVIVPSTVPAMIATFRINIGFGLVGAVVGEFISSSEGLGHMIFVASGLYDLDTVWLGLFVLMLVGFIFYHGIDALERRLLPWKEETGRRQIQV
jgi:NitT/TauT family transport system permease protein